MCNRWLAKDEDDGAIEADFDRSSQGGLLGIVCLLLIFLFLFPPHVSKYILI